MAATETTNLALGFTVPDFSLPNATQEGMVRAKDVFAGQPTVVVFMCNHCPFVIHLLESLVAFAAECKARGVDVVAISSNDVANYPQDGFEHMQALAKRHGFTFPYLYDESQEVARAYDAACTQISACSTATQNASTAANTTGPDQATTCQSRVTTSGALSTCCWPERRCPRQAKRRRSGATSNGRAEHKKAPVRRPFRRNRRWYQPLHISQSGPFSMLHACTCCS